MKYVICNCGWVSYGIPRKVVEEEIQNFNNWFDKQSPETKEMYGNKGSSILNYSCLRCGNIEFKPASQEEIDKVYGCTIGPVVYEEVIG